MKREIKETDLAKNTITYFKDLGWDIYQEVQLRSCDKRIDIVARQGDLIWGVECKVAFGLTVLDQIWRWRPYCHYISVAVGSRAISPFGEQLCKERGIGIFTSHWGREVHVDVEPKLFRPAYKDLRENLRVEHQTFAEAGNDQGLYWSPFQSTVDEIQRLVAAEPGIRFSDMMKRLKHHYRTDESARGALLKWLKMGKLRGLRFEMDGRQYKLFLKEVS